MSIWTKLNQLESHLSKIEELGPAAREQILNVAAIQMMRDGEASIRIDANGAVTLEGSAMSTAELIASYGAFLGETHSNEKRVMEGRNSG